VCVCACVCACVCVCVCVFVCACVCVYIYKWRLEYASADKVVERSVSQKVSDVDTDKCAHLCDT